MDTSTGSFEPQSNRFPFLILKITVVILIAITMHEATPAGAALGQALPGAVTKPAGVDRPNLMPPDDEAAVGDETAKGDEAAIGDEAAKKLETAKAIEPPAGKPAPTNPSPAEPPVANPPTDEPNHRSQERTKFGIEKHGAIVYHTADTYRLKCDIYQPIPATSSDQTFPTVLMIHGGAWRTGSKLSMLRHARRLTRVGYVVMSINYRLAPKYLWPAQIEDCRMALDWLNENATQYRIDKQRIGVFGYSAGAHLAAILATTNEKNASVKIRAAAVGGTPAEFSWIDDDSTALVYWLGSTKKQDAALYRAASPITFTTADDPPFLIFHGTNDWVVPIQSARSLNTELKKNDVDTKLIEVDGSGHFATFSKIELMQDVIAFFDTNLGVEKSQK